MCDGMGTPYVNVRCVRGAGIIYTKIPIALECTPAFLLFSAAVLIACSLTPFSLTRMSGIATLTETAPLPGRGRPC